MPRPIVLLVQLPIPPLGPEPIRGNVPLAGGYLKLHAERRGLGERFEIQILSAREANTLGDQALVSTIVERRPCLVGFTCYLWNIERTLWIAARVRELLPETLILLGGPEVTRDNGWLLENQTVDLAAVGEGEQTFAELLAAMVALGERPRQSLEQLPAIAGLGVRARDGFRFGSPRAPLPCLDEISSPYLAGILSAADQEQLLLETIRGCIFKCKFCYYPKAYDSLYFVSKEKILANLAHACERGAREVYLLDPTLNQRRDFIDFLRVLKDGNPEGQLEYHAELRGEGLTAESARLMREAGFKEVEIGLQSIDSQTQELMDRRNSLKAFERGVRALQNEGILTRVDLIVGLPGDTVESVRRGMHYLAENRLYDDIQVFQLSVLPGTSFREESRTLGLEHQSRPPYYTLRTPTLTLDDMLSLLAEAEVVFETTFDPLPPPALVPSRQPAKEVLPRQAVTFWFEERDPYAALDRMEARLQEHWRKNPFSTVQVVLETTSDFPFDVFHRLRATARPAVNVYLDRFYEFTPGTRAGSSRIITVIPEACRHTIPGDWAMDALAYTDLVWRGEGTSEELSLTETDNPGEWRWTPAALAEAKTK